MAEIRKIITAEEKARKKEEERKKRLGRVEVEKLPSREYEHAKVDDIVSRMKQRFEARGYGKKEGRGAELKKKVAGKRVFALDQRQAKELVFAKDGFARLVGRLYSTLPFLDALTDRFSKYSMAKRVPYDLDKANMNYSARQYVSMAAIASLFAWGFSLVLIIALSVTAFSSSVSELAGQVASPNTPLVAALVAQGVDAPMILMGVTVLLHLALAFLLSFAALVFAMLVAFQWPTNRAMKRGKAIDKEMPFALRHMATEIKAGIGIHKTMESIVEAGYGELSVEFDRTLRDIDKGVSTEDALLAMSERAPSDNLSKSVMHMVRTLKTGGNLSEIISTIANEVAFELRMKMRDFVERLNLIGLFYMMIGIVAPVFVAILAGILNAVPTIGLAGVLGTEVLFLIYFVLIPMALSLILYVIKVMQPM
ncbi:MAG: type II secretion system F family protein [Candidatus Diapherotrites archaeon]|nr:type II secretion system F family protein [Candidatus Diapherotrites archaeon]